MYESMMSRGRQTVTTRRGRQTVTTRKVIIAIIGDCDARAPANQSVNQSVNCRNNAQCIMGHPRTTSHHSSPHDNNIVLLLITQRRSALPPLHDTYRPVTLWQIINICNIFGTHWMRSTNGPHRMWRNVSTSCVLHNYITHTSIRLCAARLLDIH